MTYHGFGNMDNGEADVRRGMGASRHPPKGWLRLANPHAAGVNPNFGVKERWGRGSRVTGALAAGRRVVRVIRQP
jgi:hypothetical protein